MTVAEYQQKIDALVSERKILSQQLSAAQGNLIEIRRYWEGKGGCGAGSSWDKRVCKQSSQWPDKRAIAESTIASATSRIEQIDKVELPNLERLKQAAFTEEQEKFNAETSRTVSLILSNQGKTKESVKQTEVEKGNTDRKYLELHQEAEDYAIRSSAQSTAADAKKKTAIAYSIYAVVGVALIVGIVFIVKKFKKKS